LAFSGRSNFGCADRIDRKAFFSAPPQSHEQRFRIAEHSMHLGERDESRKSIGIMKPPTFALCHSAIEASSCFPGNSENHCQ
jgi:hypothetical protein